MVVNEIITPATLKAARDRRSAATAASAMTIVTDREQTCIRQAAAEMSRARSLLQGDLGKLIVMLNDAQHTIVMLSHYACWYTVTGEKRIGEFYQTGFILGFEPRPEKEATKELLSQLKAAGFTCHLHAETQSNLMWSDVAGDFVACGGWHDEYYLVIQW